VNRPHCPASVAPLVVAAVKAAMAVFVDVEEYPLVSAAVNEATAVSVSVADHPDVAAKVKATL
jgi:hypothetical protein